MASRRFSSTCQALINIVGSRFNVAIGRMYISNFDKAALLIVTVNIGGKPRLQNLKKIIAERSLLGGVVGE